MPKWMRHLAVPIAVLAMVAAACSKKTPAGSGSPSTAACTSTIKVGLALDVGGLGDQSFNDAANRGLQKAITDGLVCKDKVKLVPANAAGSNLDDNIQALAAAGYNYVEGVGFSFSGGVIKSAAAFPSVNFGVVDGYTACGKACGLPGDPTTNIADLNFAANQGSYLVGIAAAMQAKKDNSTTVGFLGGQTGPLIQSFQAGYQAGVASVDSSMKVLVEYIGDTTQAFVNPTAGKALSEKMYGEGADVIYHASGLSGAGLFQAAAEKKKYAIGVDSDQYLTVSAEEKPYIITSALKRVDTATYLAIKAVGDGTFKGGVQNFDLKNDGVGYATSNPTLLTADMVTAMETAKAAIIAGTIVVPDKPKS